MKFDFFVDITKFQTECSSNQKIITVKFRNQEYTVLLDNYKRGIRTVMVNNKRIKFGWKKVEDIYKIVLDGVEYDVNFSKNFKVDLGKKSSDSKEEEEVNILAPIPGLVIDVKKEIGKSVKKGDCVIILSAMKLENEIASPRDGVVKNMFVKRGATVSKNEILAIIV